MARAIIEIPGPSAYFDQALAIAARADAGEWLPETVAWEVECKPWKITIISIIADGDDQEPNPQFRAA